MKNLYTTLILLVSSFQILAQIFTPSSSTISADGIVLARFTNFQRDALALPLKGLLIFNTTTNQVEVYDGIKWKSNISAPPGSFFLNDKNIGLGTNVLNSITTGEENVAIGTSTLAKNNVGNNNIAVGNLSLKENTSGYGNAAIGSFSLITNTTGAYNTAIGTGSLNANTTGNFNVAVGYQASAYNTNGSNNVFIGTNSGYNSTNGSNNIFIGYNAQGSSDAISNEITLGDNQITALRCNTQNITSLSDIRDKKHIQDLSIGLNFINSLKPRQFNWDKREWYRNNKSDGTKIEPTPTAGFIAQELDEVQQTYKFDWLKLVYKSNPEKWEATYGNLLPIMVKAIQELSQKEEGLAKKEAILNDRVEKLMLLEARLEKIEKALSHGNLTSKLR